jgi:hypothetical protein
MALQVRRVITGHDGNGRGIVKIDEVCKHLARAGDVMVQRGTIHNWVNNGTAPCVLAVILIDAKSVEAGGKVLNAIG